MAFYIYISHMMFVRLFENKFIRMSLHHHRSAFEKKIKITKDYIAKTIMKYLKNRTDICGGRQIGIGFQTHSSN